MTVATIIKRIVREKNIATSLINYDDRALEF
jgi:hypothetical protein